MPPGSVVRLETRVGAYLVHGEPLARIWPRPDPAIVAQTARLIGEASIIGVTRTMQQDIDFGLRQLNDIGLRALSPAVNDQTTAIEVILRVSSVLRPLLWPICRIRRCVTPTAESCSRHGISTTRSTSGTRSARSGRTPRRIRR